ncbi:hypothetical protein L3Q82_002882 [Scortum barcoo]|uniref:Uncharacterized protein n=1 Tax=Scortum barcoo TaxID=214431 RepID=A0ACB8VVF0_9TELE|nr:hypothetical protein L3Q82_002882 [Scortum barcoo]
MCLRFLALLFTLFALYSPPSLFPSIECSRLCPHQCICYEHADLVDCRGRGFEQVPRGFPHGTWLLELGGNNLSEIGTRAFTGLWSLRVLVLTNSQIKEIQPQAFFSLSFLEKLDLSWNQLTSLPVDFSASLSALRELRLEHNNLRHIAGYSLEYLDNMEKLDLSYNQLVMVGHGVFRGLSRLRQLYLHNNRLTVVQQGSLDMLPGLETNYRYAIIRSSCNNFSKVTVSSSVHTYLMFQSLQWDGGNPWSCDCDLHRVFSKILHVRHLHIDDYRNVTCQEPPQLAGASLAWVDSQLCVAETATVLVITATVLVTVVAALVMAERNRKRNPGKNWDTEVGVEQKGQLCINVVSYWFFSMRCISQTDFVTKEHTVDFACWAAQQKSGRERQCCAALSRMMSSNKICSVFAIMTMWGITSSAVAGPVEQGQLRDIEYNPIIFNRVVVNQGSSYNNDTGVFTAPVAGIYQFVFAAQLCRGDHNNVWYFIVKGNRRMACLAQVSGRDTTLNTCYFMEELKRGDQVWVKQMVGSCAWASTASETITFSGVLLAREGVSTLGRKYGSGSSCPLPGLAQRRDVLSSSAGRRVTSLGHCSVTLLSLLGLLMAML